MRFLSRVLIATLLTAALAIGVAPTVRAARRRAVAHPAAASHIMQHVAADDDLRYTNLDTKDNTVRTCLENTSTCITDHLAPGASATKTDLVRSLGRQNANLEIYTTGPLEARSRFDAIPMSLATTERQTIPVMVSEQTFDIYARSHGQAEIKFLTDYGVQRDSMTIDLMPGTNRLVHNFTPKVGEQFDIIPTTPTIMTTTVNGAQYRAKALSEAAGRQFLLNVNDTTFAWAKNPDPTSTITITSMRYAPNPDQTFANWFQAVNWGTTYVNNITNGITGTVDLHGDPLTTGGNVPILVWSSANAQIIGATANSRFVAAKRYNISLNQVPPTITLFAAQESLEYVLTGYDDAGNTVGEASGSLRANESRDVSMAGLGTRITAMVKDRTDDLAGGPNLLIGANGDGVTKGGWQYVKPLAQTNFGEEMVKKYFDPFTNVYLNNAETYAMFNGSGKVASRKPAMVGALWQGPSDSWTPTQYADWITTVTNGVTSATDPELYRFEDPFTIQVTGNAINFGVVSAQTNPATFLPGTFGGLTPAQLSAMKSETRSFLIDYVNANSSKYSLGQNPTWNARNPN